LIQPTFAFEKCKTFLKSCYSASDPIATTGIDVRRAAFQQPAPLIANAADARRGNFSTPPKSNLGRKGACDFYPSISLFNLKLLNAAFHDYCWNSLAGGRSCVALALQATAGSFAWRYPDRAGRICFLFSPDNQRADFIDYYSLALDIQTIAVFL
jgi:hypothetical protein